MWEDFTPGTEAALDFRVKHPAPAAPPKPSFWGQVGEFVAAPVKGVAQGAQQTARNVNRINATQVGNPLAMSASEQEEMLQEAGITRDSQDQALRRGIDALKPDPLTSTTASMVLQDASRLLSKVGLYAVAGGPVAAAVGTGLDEGLTGFTEMRDRGVDPATAAKVGAVRGLATGVGVALPVVGKTAAATAGLVVAGGPVSFMAEQATTRAILEAADYPELAAEHDPLDPVGLGVATLVPGVVGTIAHRARVRNKAAAAVVEANPEAIDAAHVSYRAEQVEAANLGDRTSLPARKAHVEAVEASARAMDEGVAVHVVPRDVDVPRMREAMDAIRARLEAAELELAPLRGVDLPQARTPMDEPDAPALPAVMGETIDAADVRVQTAAVQDAMTRPTPTLGADPAQPAKPPAAIERAERVALQRPDLPVRMDEGDTAKPAQQVLDAVRDEATKNKTDSLAFKAAVECMLRG